MKKKFIYSLFLFVALFSACSTDLDVVGQYKETLVVYGLLDQTQAKQYIKINKAFLGEGNAFTYAQIKDSTQFVNSLNVKLQKLDGFGNMVLERTLTPDNSIIKDPGVFYAPDQTNVIYSVDNVTLGPGFFNTNNTYKLIVTNGETGTVVSSNTGLITDIGAFLSPTATSSAFGFIVPGNPNAAVNISWNSARYARMYQVLLRFNYLDSNLTGNDTNHIDWLFPVQTTQGLTGNETMLEEVKGQSYLQFIGSQFLTKPLPDKARRALKTDVILISGADDLNTFIEVNAPSTGIVQEKPEFTNITNGLGIFSSRYNKAPFSKNLSRYTLDSLACGQYTKHYKFLNGQGQLINCP